jgi:hypothetical protein
MNKNKYLIIGFIFLIFSVAIIFPDAGDGIERGIGIRSFDKKVFDYPGNYGNKRISDSRGISHGFFWNAISE